MSKALPIKDFLGYYITDTGNVYSRVYHPIKNRYSRIIKLKLWKNKQGYLCVDLKKDGKRVHKRVNRLVAQAFIANPENKPEVNHIDGNKQNNHVDNLEFGSYSENLLHSYKILNRKAPWTRKFGKEHNRSKSVVQIKNGIIIAEFGGLMEAERNTGISHSSISNCCRSKRNSAGKCQWKYKDLK